ncbi:MAG: hypothetical protein GX221_11160 [Candidatus Riflebacteria bacterium]|nr:hypothetical protein [Candidatus Riflebacteria bacterium]
MKRIFLILIASILYLNALSVLQAQTTFVLKAGDPVLIMVAGEPELTASTVIDRMGNVNLPLIGFVGIQGLKPSEAEKLIEARYKEGFLRNPYVTVTLPDFSSPLPISEKTQKVPVSSVPSGFSVAPAIAERHDLIKAEQRRETPKKAEIYQASEIMPLKSEIIQSLPNLPEERTSEINGERKLEFADLKHSLAVLRAIRTQKLLSYEGTADLDNLDGKEKKSEIRKEHLEEKESLVMSKETVSSSLPIEIKREKSFAKERKAPESKQQVRLRIVDSVTDAPLSEALIYSLDKIYQTDKRGSCVLNEFAEHLTVLADGYVTRTGYLEELSEKSVIKMQPAPVRPSLTITVLDGFTNMPLKGVEVRIGKGTVRTNNQGQFKISSITEEYGNISLSKKGYRPLSMIIDYKGDPERTIVIFRKE